MAKKDQIEAEIEAHSSVLRLNNSTMQSPLVDSQGFPRDDVDIYAVRGARKRIIELRNDLKACIQDVGKALEKVYEPQTVSANENGGQSSGSALLPFARVDAVSPGSPASDAVCSITATLVSFLALIYYCVLGPSETRPDRQIRTCDTRVLYERTNASGRSCCGQ